MEEISSMQNSKYRYKKQDTGYFYYLVSCWHLFGLEFILEFNLSLFPYMALRRTPANCKIHNICGTIPVKGSLLKRSVAERDKSHVVRYSGYP